MIQVWVDGQGFKKTVDGFKDLRKGDRFRVVEDKVSCLRKGDHFRTIKGKVAGPIMIAKGNPYRTVKNNKTVWVIKADFDLEVDT